MSMSLRGKTVLVTGASSGIGAATAMEFARLGTRLLLCARRIDMLEDMKAGLIEAGAAEVFCFALDVQVRDEVECVLNTLPAAWEQIDVLVNNAGLSRGLKKLWEDNVDDWEEMIDTNVKGTVVRHTRGGAEDGGARKWARHQSWLDRWTFRLPERCCVLRIKGSREVSFRRPAG